LTAPKSGFYGLIDNSNGSSDRCHRIETLNILRIETDTPVTNSHTYSKGASLVCAVNQIPRYGEFEGEFPERIIRISARDHCGKFNAVLRMFLSNAFWRIPRRINLLRYDLSDALRGPPVVVADTHRKGMNGLSARWKEIET
jgi:hypothetical protein